MVTIWLSIRIILLLSKGLLDTCVYYYNITVFFSLVPQKTMILVTFGQDLYVYVYVMFVFFLRMVWLTPLTARSETFLAAVLKSL